MCPAGGGGDIPVEVWRLSMALFAVLLIGELCHAIPIYYTFNWWVRIKAELRSDLLAYTLGHSYTYFQNHFAGSLARKVTEGIEKGLGLSEQVRWNILLPFTVMISSTIVLFKISVLYGLITMAFIFAVLLPVFLKLRKLKEKSRIYADKSSDVSGQVVDSLTNIAAVKSFAHEHREMEEHKRVSEAQMKAWHLSGGIIHVMESLGYLNDSLTTLIKPHTVKDKDDARKMQIGKGHIEFRDVHFKYQDKPIFEAMNIDIQAGQRIGLIGESGAGKSTFINLIQRFFEIGEGAILIEGQDIADVTQSSLRSHIAVIPQDTSLFHRTIMENIRYGRLDASDEEVIAAAEKAYAMDFIDELPEKFETYVGERGVKLSGGQRQRIAIARAILKDSPILILDEATSALDSESEKQIQAALKNLMQDKTVIAIAHRLSTINHLDRLLVMEDGKIVEDGTHEELVAAKGVYEKLWTMQSGGFLPKD